MRVLLAALGFAAAFSLVARASDTGTNQRKVVVELFTSQGCSSCPPADKVLGELAQMPMVLALSLPVDYWDNLGWADTFAKPEFTARQRAYAAARQSPQVYTPQAMIDGVEDVVGSRRQMMLGIIASRSNLAPTLNPKLLAGPQGLSLLIEASDRADLRGANITVLHYRHRGHAIVKRGENGGRELDYRNVVTDMKVIGVYQGQVFQQMLADHLPEAGTGMAVLIQNPRLGPIFGAAAFDS